MKMIEARINLVVLYGSEVWGCCSNLDQVEQLQLRAPRMFYGVDRRHPRASLMLETGVLPVPVFAKIQCLDF